MKLLLENWRKYLAEETQPIKKLRIFDFDDSDIHLNDVKQLRNDFPEIEDIRIKKVIPGDILSLQEIN